MGASLSFLLEEEEEEDARVDDAVLEGWRPRKARLLQVVVVVYVYMSKGADRRVKGDKNMPSSYSCCSDVCVCQCV